MGSSQFTTVTGAPTPLSSLTPLAVDPTFLAARVAFRPLDYQGEGQVLGHYKVGLKTGAIAATLGAASDLVSFQWNPTISAFAVLMSISVAVAIQTGVTTGVPLDLEAFNVRSFTVQAAAGGGAVTFGAQNQKNRSTMGSSLANIWYANSTTKLTAGTYTADSLPFATTPLNSVSPTVVGSASPLTELYSWKALGQHPEVYGVQEGFVIRNIAAGPASGAINYYFNLEWAEVVLF